MDNLGCRIRSGPDSRDYLKKDMLIEEKVLVRIQQRQDNMSSIPPSIRKILTSGRGEMVQLERQYHIWLIITVLGIVVEVALISVSFLLFLDATPNLSIPRILVGMAALVNIVVLYVVSQETLSRRRYIFEVKRMMVTGLSFLESIRRGLRDLF